jgi:hypothetical protein
MQRTRKFYHNRNFPIFIFLLFGIILGLILFQDFGASYDEPSYYFFGGITLKAYADLLGGIIQSFYRHYGQPFFVAGLRIHSLLSFIFPNALSIDVWHLIIYLSFLLEVFFFYKLAQRWVSTTAATISVLLFASQPVLFGLSWFDPKDVPFMVFFLGSIYLGLVFSDQASLIFKNQAQSEPTMGNFSIQRKTIHTKREKTAAIFDVFLCVLSLLLVIGAGAIRKFITDTILAIDINHPARFVDKIFVKLPIMHRTCRWPRTLTSSARFSTIY